MMIRKQSHSSKQELKEIIEKVFKATSKDCENIRDSKYLKCLASEQKFQCYIYNRLCNALENNMNLLVLVEYRPKKYKEFDLVIFKKKKNFMDINKENQEKIKNHLKRTARWPQTYAPKQVKEYLTKKLTPIVALELKMGDQIGKFADDCEKLKDLKKGLIHLEGMYAILITEEGRPCKRNVNKMGDHLKKIKDFKEDGGEAWHITQRDYHEFDTTAIKGPTCAFDSSK